MRELIFIFLLSMIIWDGTLAQDLHINYYDSIDLYEGMDESFYSESSFGVKNPIYSAYPVAENLRFNRVEGLFFGIQEDKMGWNNSSFLNLDNIDVHGLLGYSTALKEV